jgi:hypothetical protein
MDRSRLTRARSRATAPTATATARRKPAAASSSGPEPLNVKRFGGGIVARFPDGHRVFAAPRVDNVPAHAVCWSCRPTGRAGIPADVTCDCEAATLALLPQYGFRNVR